MKMKNAETRRKEMVERQIERENKLRADINAYCNIVLEQKMDEAEAKDRREVIISVDEILNEFDGSSKSVEMFFEIVANYGYTVRNSQASSKDYAIEW